MKVEELMTERVLTVAPDTPLKDVAALLVEHDVSGLPVVDGGYVVGVVSETDILYKERDPGNGGGLLAHLFHRGEAATREKLEARTAGEAMTSPAVMVRPTARADVVAGLMLERGVDRVVVADDGRLAGELDEGGKLVGIVTRGDFVRAFARSDAEIANEIADVIERLFVLSPSEAQASVVDGEVTLTGDVDVRATAEALSAAVRRIPGVVSVRSELAWRREKAKLSSTRDGIYAGTGGRWPS